MTNEEKILALNTRLEIDPIPDAHQGKFFFRCGECKGYVNSIEEALNLSLDHYIFVNRRKINSYVEELSKNNSHLTSLEKARETK
jgi:hypothetical protein